MPSSTTAKPLTLTQAAYTMRKVILVGGITLGLLMVGRFTIGSFIAYWQATHPAPPPPPTVGFGPLPKVEYPANVGTPTSIKLEIPPNRLRAQVDRAKVFFIPYKRANLLALEKAKSQTAALGFLFEPESLTAELYRWQRNQPIAASLDYNIISGTFTMKMDWQSDPAFLQDNVLPNEDRAISETRQILAAADLIARDVATSSAKVTYLKAAGIDYTKTVSLSESDFLQIDIFRDDIDGLPVVTEIPNKGTIRTIITGKSSPELRVAQIDYHYVPVAYESYHTYPIIDASTAFKMLQEGKGYTASMPDTGTDVTIRSIRLAYFDTSQTQQYLQPIYMLEGDGGYVGYVTALKSACYAIAQTEFVKGCL